jgi:serine/threonine-protein kinase
VAAALDATHRAGLLHRDVKPGNIVLDPATGRVVLIDFGLARAAGGDDQITEYGERVGTPAYLPPETPCGVTTPAGDLYQLGSVLHEMLTGVPAGVARVALPVWVPSGLAGLVRRLTDPHPTARPASAAALLGELSAFE